MAGFRLTGGGGGCPPTETPPNTYQNPFRFDDAGRLWLKDCSVGLHYLGEARHDIASNTLFGEASTPVTSDVVNGAPITAGTYTNAVVTNNTNCTLSVLIGLELSTDLYVRQDQFALVTLSARLNGANVSRVATSSIYLDTGSDGIRNIGTAAAGPHPVTTLAPGQQATSVSSHS